MKHYLVRLHDSGGQVWGSVSDARPLVVIDPEDREAVERLNRAQDAEYARRGIEVVDTHRVDVEVMQAALREFAAPKPPKPEEPHGLGAVVEDEGGAKWILVYDEVGDVRLWAPLGRVSTQSAWREYHDIAAVRVLSEGVPS